MFNTLLTATFAATFGNEAQVSSILWIVFALVVAAVIITIFMRFIPVGLWISALAACRRYWQ